MSLNIKNERVHAMAKEAAARTGLTQTSVIELALERLLESTPDPGERRGAHVDSLLSDLRARIGGTDLSTDDLYDGAGLYR